MRIADVGDDGPTEVERVGTIYARAYFAKGS
jgi:hypothetical protein